MRRYLGEALTGSLLGLLAAVLALVLTGCTALGRAKVASNALRAELHQVEPDLRRDCITPYEGAASLTPDEASALGEAYDRSGCPQRLRAYDGARKVHLLLHASVGAAELGECAGVHRSVEYCDLASVVADALRVAGELERARAR